MKKYILKSAAGQGGVVPYEEDLNPEQYAAVTESDGPVLVLAGAGTGKTRTITYRAARLIESGLNPRALLLMTFTNKAAREMLRRVEELLGLDVRGFWAGTFHHVGNLILRRHADRIGFASNYSILDREDSRDLLDGCVAARGIERKKLMFPKSDVLQAMIGLGVNTGRKLDDIVMDRYPHFIPLIDQMLRVAGDYREKKKSLNMLDFDDLLAEWARLLEECPDLRARYEEQFEHILVDEYQDTNALQARIVDLLGKSRGNVYVVGDDAQSIYSFRGASFRNILGFPERYPEARIHKLTTNYRSTPEILRVANETLRHSGEGFRKELTSVAPPGEAPLVAPLRDVYQQAAFVAQRIEELHHEGRELGEIAVLYRSHFHSMEIQMELTRRGIPFEIRSGIRFFEQAHIKDVTSYLRICVNPRDEVAWSRVLKLLPGIGKVTARKLIERILTPGTDPLENLFADEIAKTVKPSARDGFEGFVQLMGSLLADVLRDHPAEMIRTVVDKGYGDDLYRRFPNAQSRLDDLDHLAEYALRFERTESFLSDLALLSSVTTDDVSDGEGDAVVLTTVHQAKGLEWPAVFVVWLAEGHFPSGRSVRIEEEEEERRLFHVAVTRAGEHLCLCFPREAHGWKGLSFFSRSRFIEELPDDAVESVSVEEGYY